MAHGLCLALEMVLRKASLPWHKVRAADWLLLPSLFSFAHLCLFLWFSLSQTVLDNPTNFQNPFQFEITFECLQELEDGAWNIKC